MDQCTLGFCNMGKRVAGEMAPALKAGSSKKGHTTKRQDAVSLYLLASFCLVQDGASVLCTTEHSSPLSCDGRLMCLERSSLRWERTNQHLWRDWLVLVWYVCLQVVAVWIFNPLVFWLGLYVSSAGSPSLCSPLLSYREPALGVR